MGIHAEPMLYPRQLPLHLTGHGTVGFHMALLVEQVLGMFM